MAKHGPEARGSGALVAMLTALLPACGQDAALAGSDAATDALAAQASDAAVADGAAGFDGALADSAPTDAAVAQEVASDANGGAAADADPPPKCTATGCPAPASPCQYSQCVPGVGCVAMALPDGALCDDGDACTVASLCQAGDCLGAAPKPCGDANPCTTDACTAKTGACTHLPLDATPCDDDDACTVDTACKAGQCAGGIGICACQSSADCQAQEDGLACNGQLYCDPMTQACKVNPKTVVVCPAAQGPCFASTCAEPTGTCQQVPLKTGAACSDGDPCTAGDACQQGGCVAGTDLCCKADLDCQKVEDGNLCNGTLYCDLAAGTCQVNPKTVVQCPSVDDSACAKNACVPKTGLCALLLASDGTSCDDGNPCTESQCKQGACQPGTSTCQCQSDVECAKFEDGNLCNGVLYCNLASKTCQPNAASVVVCAAPQDSACAHAQCQPQTGLCALQLAPNASPCNADGNPCTGGDHCELGTCVAGTNVCACQKDADCKKLEDGDLCNGTLYCDQIAHKCQVNPATVVQCPTVDDSVCGYQTCAPKTGSCGWVARNELQACDADGNPCTALDQCQQGQCAAGANLCQCQKDADCAALDDSNPCNGKLYCDKATAKCKPNPASVVQCPGGADSACQWRVCQPQSGKCALVPRNELGTCDADGNPCTVEDRCQGGKCKAGLNQCQCGLDQDCSTFDDANVCNGKLACSAVVGPGANGAIGLCGVATATVVQCGQGGACLADVCQPKTGACKQQPINDGKGCDDGIACTGADQCQQGACAGTQPGCDDGESCTFDVCDLAKKACAHGPLPCADNDPCTADACVQGQGCSHKPQEASCNDGNLCTKGDKCTVTTETGKPATVVCLAGTATASCDDQTVCTLDACSPTAGCVHANEAGPCNDGNACSLGETCKQGACLTVEALACNDGNPCSSDDCQETTGCVYLPSAATCSDGNPCTTADACLAMVCKGKTPLACSDDNPCTDDACAPTKGCVHNFNSLPCNDKKYCTVNDTCDGAGECLGAARDCAGQVGAGPCLLATCNNSLDQCDTTKLVDGTACDDGFDCTLVDQCDGKGKCLGANDACVEEVVNAAKGAIGTPAIVATPDGGYAVQWLGGSGVNSLRLVDVYGSRIAEQRRLDSLQNPGALQPAPRLVVLADGKVMALHWEGKTTGQCIDTNPEPNFGGVLVADFVAPDGSVTSKPAVKNVVVCKVTKTTNFTLTDTRLIPFARPAGGYALLSHVRPQDWQKGSPVALDVLLHTLDSNGAPVAPVVHIDAVYPTFFPNEMTDFEHAAMPATPGHNWFVIGHSGGSTAWRGFSVWEHGVNPAQLVAGPWSLANQKYNSALTLKVDRVVPALGGGFWLAATKRAGPTAAGDIEIVRLLAPPPSLKTATFVAAASAADESGADLGALSDGSLVVAWTVAEGDGSGSAVQAARFDADGKTLGPPFVVNQQTQGDQRDVALTVLANDEFAVAFRDSAGNVWTRRFGKDGKPSSIKLERFANQTTLGNQDAVSVAATPDGSRGLLAWAGPVPGLDGLEVRGRVVDASGKPLGAEFALNQTTADNQAAPAVAGTVAGFVAAWQGYGQDGAQETVVGRVFDDAGVPTTGEVVLNTTTKGNQTHPAVGASPGGLWMAAWIDDNLSGSVNRVMVRGFDKAGTPLSGELSIAGFQPGAATPRVVHVAGTSDFLTAWIQTISTGQQRVHLRRISAGGAAVTPAFSSPNSYVANSPYVAVTLAANSAGAVTCARYGGGLQASVACAPVDLVKGTMPAPLLLPDAAVGSPHAPALAAAAGGQFRVAWHSDAIDGSGFAIQAVPVGIDAKVVQGAARIQANRTTQGSQYAPALAWLQGGMLTAWVSEGQDGSGSAVVYRVLP
ncbi:MAG: hypothetical protein EXR79_15790 [Myxococcales bacterium]|nr:hypothetical protein [Myxococcales bacterium]